jgi:hypothetical protein
MSSIEESTTVINHENSSDNEEESEMSFEQMDLSSLLETFFTDSKKNRNVVDVLLEIKRTIDTQNNVLIEMLKVFTKFNKNNTPS